MRFPAKGFALAGPLVLAVVLIASFTTSSKESGASQGEGEIRLVLQITVDGLRGDLLERYREGFGEGGFKRLLEDGAVFSNAHYQHANTETIVGHTTLATGATPSQHGMIGNAWLDREEGRLAYNIEDPDHPLLPSRDNAAIGAQVDPAQKAARSNGRSPRNILVPTFSDTLAAYHAGKSKVFAVSGKDRGAVPMAGGGGKAFWFSTDTADFITSSYYYEEYPKWAADWNGERKGEKHAGTNWELSGSPESYKLIAQDDRPYEVDLKGFGRVFPHPYGRKDPLFATRLLVSPVGDELVADFAKALVTAEELGKDEVPDFLALSFSAVDAVNHFFGPSSLENEETVRRLDRTLADLLSHIDEVVGLDRTLIVLSADHGMADMPEYSTSLGYDAGRLDPQEIVDVANAAGQELGVEAAVKYFFRPYLYLDDEKIEAAGVDREQVASAIAAAITGIQGVHLAAASHDLDGRLSDPAIPQILNNDHSTRSGDIYVFQEPYWFLFDKGPVACMHGSPWAYDTHVPIIFSGPSVMPGRIVKRVHPADIAPTMSALLGMSPPAAARGEVLLPAGN